MDPVAPPSPVPAITGPSSATPAPGNRKPVILMVGIAALLLIIVIGGIVYLYLRRSSDSTATPAASTQPLPSGSEASATATPENIPAAQNLKVAISYASQPQFNISVDQVEYVSVPPTIDLIKPTGLQPYSIIRIIDSAGAIITEERFSISAFFISEGEDLTPAQLNLPAGNEDIILSLPAGIQPARVEIASGRGTVIDSADVPPPSSPADGSVLGESTGKFVIAVINEKNAAGQVSAVADAASTMVRTIHPWSKYKGQVDVKTVNNTTVNLGCTTVTGPSGNYPVCSNQGRIASAVAEAIGTWNTIIVVTSAPCICGTVSGSGSTFGNITAVGGNIEQRTLAHELGHSVGKLTDEYMYKFGGLNINGLNCFDTETQCQSAISSYAGNTDAECSSGCNIEGRWRPASLLMYNNLRSGRFGPLEALLLEQKITAALGITLSSPSPSPVASASVTVSPSSSLGASPSPVASPTISPAASPSDNPNVSPSPSPSTSPNDFWGVGN